MAKRRHSGGGGEGGAAAAAGLGVRVVLHLYTAVGVSDGARRGAGFLGRKTPRSFRRF
jgi:hypothetical protein